MQAAAILPNSHPVPTARFVCLRNGGEMEKFVSQALRYMGRSHCTDPSRFERLFQGQSDAPPCFNCGTVTVRAGNCYSCPNCGEANGCG